MPRKAERISEIAPEQKPFFSPKCAISTASSGMRREVVAGGKELF